MTADAHAAMLAQLRRPGACGGHPDAAGLLQTHLSSLLLAGDRVFKLMRPVALPFVDFSTLDKRHAACLDELQLNRRTAPHWYQAVVPVLDDGQGACIADPDRPPPPGTVVDWAVRMRRFDDRALYSRLAARGALSADQVEALAAAVAQFHTSLPPSPPGFGSPAGVRAMAAQNLQELADLLAAVPWQGLPGAAAAAAGVAGLQAWTTARGAALAGLMQARLAAGQVREGHGDLHLGNVVWADGAPVLFDALAFDARAAPHRSGGRCSLRLHGPAGGRRTGAGLALCQQLAGSQRPARRPAVAGLVGRAPGGRARQGGAAGAACQPGACPACRPICCATWRWPRPWLHRPAPHRRWC